MLLACRLQRHLSRSAQNSVASSNHGVELSRHRKSVSIRARIILRAADGCSNNAIAKQLGISRASVIEWRGRFGVEGVECLGKARPGRGRPQTVSPNKAAELVQLTLNSVPEGATHWSCRTMAKRVGVSPATVQLYGASTASTRTRFALSSDPGIRAS